jgi:hypothetical protein
LPPDEIGARGEFERALKKHSEKGKMEFKFRAIKYWCHGKNFAIWLGSFHSID